MDLNILNPSTACNRFHFIQMNKDWDMLIYTLYILKLARYAIHQCKTNQNVVFLPQTFKCPTKDSDKKALSMWADSYVTGALLSVVNATCQKSTCSENYTSLHPNKYSITRSTVVWGKQPMSTVTVLKQSDPGTFHIGLPSFQPKHGVDTIVNIAIIDIKIYHSQDFHQSTRAYYIYIIQTLQQKPWQTLQHEYGL